MSTTTSIAAGVGIEYAHASLYNATKAETQLIESDVVVEENDTTEVDNVEYDGTFVIDEENMIELPSLEQRSNSFLFENDVPAGKLGYSKYFSVSEGGRIVLSVTVDPGDVSIKAGIIYPDGSMVYVRGSDLISYTFTMEKAGRYRIYIENDSNTPVAVSGTVLYE